MILLIKVNSLHSEKYCAKPATSRGIAAAYIEEGF